MIHLRVLHSSTTIVVDVRDGCSVRLALEDSVGLSAVLCCDLLAA